MPVFTAAVMSAGQLELEAQQIRLRSQAPGVANEVSVTAQDAVTGDDDGDGIGAVRGRNRTDRVGVARTLGQLQVGDGRTVRYLLQSVPHALLKCRSDQAQWQVESLPRAAEVLAEFFPGGAQQVIVSLDVVGIEFTPDTRIDGGAPGAITPVAQAQLAGVGAENEFADRGLEILDFDSIQTASARRYRPGPDSAPGRVVQVDEVSDRIVNLFIYAGRSGSGCRRDRSPCSWRDPRFSRQPRSPARARPRAVGAGFHARRCARRFRCTAGPSRD